MGNFSYEVKSCGIMQTNIVLMTFSNKKIIYNIRYKGYSKLLRNGKPVSNRNNGPTNQLTNQPICTSEVARKL